MLTHSKKFSIILSVLLALGLLFTAAPGQVRAFQGDVSVTMQAGADRLTALQNDDGGWDWPLDDGSTTNISPKNTLGPIAKGLAEAYLHTGDSDHLSALTDAGALLLSKTNNFSPSDGYLAAQLDEVFSVTTYTDHLDANYYGPLAAGTYDRNGAGTLYDAAGYVALIRTSRSGTQANMAAWDIGMGLVGAVAAGADTTAWIAGVEDEINELDSSAYYDVIGLAGAIYGLAEANVDFDPAAGSHASASNLSDLAEILAGYQINNGGFTWNSAYVIPNDYNETTQETAYAILALNAVNRNAYFENIRGAAAYLMDSQLPTGGWNHYEIEVDGENNELTGEALWAISVAYPELWVCPSGDCGHPNASYNTIQAAINAAVGGGTIYVAVGSYTGPLTVNKPLEIKGSTGATVTGQITVNADNVTLTGLTVSNPGGSYGIIITATSENISISGNVFSDIGSTTQTSNVKGIYLQYGPDNVSIIGNTFNNIHSNTYSVNAIFIGDSNTLDPSTNVIIDGNVFTNISSVVKGGYAILTNNGAGTIGLQITNNTFDTISGGWTHAVGLEGPTPSAVVFNNIFAGLTATGIDNSAIFFEANPDGDTVAISDNQFTPGFYGVAIHPNSVESVGTVNATSNWWGSLAGPETGQIGGDVSYSPWCGDADCSFLNPNYLPADVTPAGIQSAIDTAPTGTAVVLPPGTFTTTGFNVSNPGVTIVLSNGTIIKNNSPCFNISADNTTVTTETLGGAKCVPTNGDNGINVAAGVSGVRIIGLEIDGTGQTTGDGIHFAGAVTDYQIVDNYIHDLDGDAVEFTVPPAGTVMDIQGNLFKNNTGYGVNNSAGTSAINAQYNSWGHKDGAAAGDGINGLADAVNPTYVELYMTSSGTPWANQVVKYKQISYTVYANLRNVMGTEFTLTYPTAALGYDGTSYSLGTAFDNQTFTAEANSGTMHFKAYNMTDSVSGDAVKLFTVTFEAKNVFGSQMLDLVDASADFTMAPSAGPSTNIYPNLLTDGTVKVIELPVLTSTAAASYYLTGVNQEFTISLSNLNGADYAKGVFYYRFLNTELADISSFQFQEMVQSPIGTWYNMPQTQVGANVEGFWGDPVNGYPLPAGYTGSNPFRITFANPGTYAFEIWYQDIAAGTELARLTGSIVVYEPPTISTSMSGPFLGGIESQYGVTLTNPTTGINKLVRSKFTLFNSLLSEIASIQYFEVKSGTWQNLGITQDGADVVGWFGPSTGFPMANPYDATSQFRVTFANGNTKTYSYKVELFDFDVEPDRLLATYEDSFNVYAQYGLTGTFSMQGRVNRGGVPVTLTSTTLGFPYGPWTIFSSDVLGTNWSLNNVAVGEYRLTTNQPRYLDVTEALNKLFTMGTANDLITILELKGGDANDDNAVGAGDASIIGAQYGWNIDTNGDVNFSGKVDIFDLALVGGNFNQTSATAYGAWIP